jgi:hypothetical protein
MQEELFFERKNTDSMLRALRIQMAKEKTAFERHRISSEKLTRVNRVIDMRAFLRCVRKEKVNLEGFLEELLIQQSQITSVLKNEEESKAVHSELSDVNRIMSRRRLELEEAGRFLELLESEGSAAKENELEEAKKRVAVARTKFFELKSRHSELIDAANVLGRHGFPEVWRNIPHVIRGGALLSLESYQDVQVLRPPNIFLGLKGNVWVFFFSLIIFDDLFFQRQP